MPINIELENLYYEDLEDRVKYDDGTLTESKLSKRDAKRLETFLQLEPKIDANEIWNCHYACLILMHSGATEPQPYEKAHWYAKKAIDMGSNVTKWLFAASLDRWLVSQGKEQKYGTQYDLKTGLILPYDKETSDEERKKYGIPPIKDLLQRH